MNNDTIRTITQIKSNGYYKQGATLGEGGWGEVYKFASAWKHYVLEIDGQPALEITARNDEIAMNAFENLFRLDECELWEVYEHKVTFRTVKGNID